MHRHKEQLDRLLRGPAGGMLACLLLAATLGGVAVAGPGGSMFEPGGGAGPGAAAAAAKHGNARERASTAGPENGGHDMQDCRRVVRHLQGDLASGDHGGLTQAITVVLDGCERHTQAPGLLRALHRLAANHERQLARHEAQLKGESGASGTAPGHDGTAPGHDGTAPGHDGTAPGHDGTAPGHAGSAPGSDAKPSAPRSAQGNGSQGKKP